jgi:hypothetical protein
MRLDVRLDTTTCTARCTAVIMHRHWSRIMSVMTTAELGKQQTIFQLYTALISEQTSRPTVLLQYSAMDPEEQTCLLHALFMYANWLPCGRNGDGKACVPRYFHTKLSIFVAFCDRLGVWCIICGSTSLDYTQSSRNQLETIPQIATLQFFQSSMQ